MRNIFLMLALAGAATHVFCLILMMSALDRRGQKTSFLLARLYSFKYASDYKKATRQETGRTGILFPLWTGSILVALLAVLAAVIFR